MPHTVKLVLVGESQVGKTSIIKYFGNGKKADGRFMPVTMGMDFVPKTVDREVNGVVQTVQVQLWDTAGQERFRTISKQVYRTNQGSSLAIVIAYDITDRDSFDGKKRWQQKSTSLISSQTAEEQQPFDQRGDLGNVEYWVDQVKQHANETAVSCLVGNKVDQAENRAVQREEGEQLAKASGVKYFYETSAATGEAIEEMILNVVDEAIRRKVEEVEGERTSSFRLPEPLPLWRRRPRCCQKQAG